MKLVLAGNFAQASNWARDAGLPRTPSVRNGWVYGKDDWSITGLELESSEDIVVTGLFWERRDATHLLCLAENTVRRPR